MERLPVNPRIRLPAVKPIAQERMANSLTVDPNLMRPARMQLYG